MNTAARITPPKERLIVSTLVVWDRGGEITGEEEEGEAGGFQALLVSVVRVVMGRLVGAGDSVGVRRRTAPVDSGCGLAAGGVSEGSVLEASGGAVWGTDIGDCGDSKEIRGSSFGARCGTSSADCMASFGASGAGVVSVLPAVTVEEMVMVTGGISSLGGVQ